MSQENSVPALEIRALEKRFGAVRVLENLSLSLAPGELLALLGPSGSGKTTLLRILAGLEFPDGGQVLFSGQDVTDSSARTRGVGLVFQHYALFRHLSALENVVFGLRVRPRGQRPPEREIRARGMALLEQVELGWAAGRRPHQLSGGQRQRVALARALAVEPKLLLLDEPFGALDAQVRFELRRWLRALLSRLGVTTVFVTHDQDEALELADRVAILSGGRLEQVGTPAEVYGQPASEFVYHFLGRANKLEWNGETRWVRPHEFEVSARPLEGALEGIVRHLRPVGASVRLEVEVVAHPQRLEGPGTSVQRLEGPGTSVQRLEVEVAHAQVEGLSVGSSAYLRPLGRTQLVEQVTPRSLEKRSG